ncbi:MAG TPA: sigma-70 family RNA polymerase sigma factor [Actinomycetota bacterium]|nr:sigma-70 family RNA polymerase sigma factor [Actinomycetota bacterium]
MPVLPLMPHTHNPEAAHQTQTWLAEYAKTKDPALRDQIVLAHLQLAERLATRFREGPTFTHEDLLQTARTGLVAAVTRYDPQRGVPFLPYAIACVIGEIKRSLRDTSWRLHVSRRTKDLTLQLLPEIDRLRVQLGRSPTIAELAARLHTSQELVTEAIQAADTRVVLSLDHPLGHSHQPPVPLGDTLAATTPTDEPEDLLMLPQLIARLPHTERQVVVLYFFHERKQQDIATQLGCSQMQVSRLLRRALTRLRATLLVP